MSRWATDIRRRDSLTPNDLDSKSPRTHPGIKPASHFQFESCLQRRMNHTRTVVHSSLTQICGYLIDVYQPAE
jgi:hypothetical protein